MVTALKSPRAKRPTAVIAELEHVAAQRDLLRSALVNLRKLHRGNEFMRHEDQQVLWLADAAIAETER